MNIKKLNRVKEELVVFLRIWNKFNFKSALVSLKAKLINRRINNENCDETLKDIQILNCKHRIIDNYLKDEMSDFIANYAFSETASTNSEHKNCIWICWWQGLENAPLIVKKCVESIKKSCDGFEVVILTNDNVDEYCHIPEIIRKKREKGIISNTHYSDFLRVQLLAEHGGIWLDSTFYAKNLDVKAIMSLPVWSIKRPEYGHLSAACGRFANYSFACDYEHRYVFGIIRDYLYEYWNTHNYMIDYLFLDNLISIVIDNNNNVKELFNGIPTNNPQCDNLQKVINTEYNELTWNEMANDTQLFKLSWKREYCKTANGDQTYFAKIIRNEL